MDVVAVKALYDRLKAAGNGRSLLDGVAIVDLRIEDSRLFAKLEDGRETEIVERH